jgi:hypothetical protein
MQHLDAGAFGESVSSSVVSAASSTQVIDVKVSAPVSGALGYRSTLVQQQETLTLSIRVAPAAATFTLQGTVATAGATAPSC